MSRRGPVLPSSIPCVELATAQTRLKSLLRSSVHVSVDRPSIRHHRRCRLPRECLTSMKLGSAVSGSLANEHHGVEKFECCETCRPPDLKRIQ